MIKIKQPCIVRADGKSRLVSDLEVDGVVTPLWIEVDAAFERFLVSDRSDAFVVGLLYWALAKGHDIVCEAPVHGELLYHIQNELIPVVAKCSRRLKKITVSAPVVLSGGGNAGAVGTGISCGADSLYTVYTHIGQANPSANLTHLVFDNVGSHTKGPQMEELHSGRLEIVRAFAAELGLPLVEVDSNLMKVVDVKFFRNNIYAHCFTIHALGGLFKTYLMSGHSEEFLNYEIERTHKRDSSDYSLLLLQVFSTRDLVFICAGGAVSKMEKMKVIVRNPLTARYLNVCISSVRNCTACVKCVRALLRLDAFGVTDDFGSVFDLDVWRRNRFKYVVRLLFDCLKRKPYAVELFPFYWTKLVPLGLILFLAAAGIAAAALHFMMD